MTHIPQHDAQPARGGGGPRLEDIDSKGLPRFIIIGAQKSGTSSLHHILSCHEQVFIPSGEVFFFDVDDVEQHPDFFARSSSHPRDRDLEANLETYLAWYRGFFARAGEDQLIGEDSTTYLASTKAPARIARMLPEVKLIALLRDPVRRAYSHYWHWVTTGRVSESFEKVLRTRPRVLLDRGKYDLHLERYGAFFGQDRLRVVIFDDFIGAQDRVISDLCSYLGLEGTVDLSSIDAHRNAARPPLSTRGRLLANRLWPAVMRKNYNKEIPGMPGYRQNSLKSLSKRSALSQNASELLTAFWPRKSYPKMNPRTRKHLQDIYRPNVERLSEMLGRDLFSLWKY